ncbi:MULTISPECIES: signal peptide peptidase SppA [Haloarcula]|uniref:Signal peptide peptidase SppA n=1 Tax=Haloarcula pellucida TaxID=1427151 RepID=A0A830GIA4_9EURY|nr:MULTISPECIES: signal peptide peptidase SppA [Halomicroarcula]MBX0346884.1 signal peptide peptidase SppA [Halomicroarcula pellucida]MDS0277242.1 signal peptide peptidase SppA [Halomicroarcula sp. S1AR25-4]GGN85936.1 signal peptide peptidase SppA [Halomicroarcula pellucida]
MVDADALERGGIVLAVVVVAVLLGWVVFVVVPDDFAELLGVVLVLVTVVVAARIGSNAAGSLVPAHNVAEVAVEGPITRDGGGGIASPPTGASADDVVEQIERADEDKGAEALLLKLNTPGGQIVPSEDIRLAAERFDGPTVAYATDVCASGGYDIAAGCDELWAREGSIVGSIGVIGSRVNAKDLADQAGLSYEQFTAGEYKDAGTPLKEMTDDEREYLQGIVDDYYDQFVETVAAGREMDDETIRETEARIFLGTEAHERGLVDDIGTRDDIEDRLETHLGETVTVAEFEPERGLMGRLRGGAQRVAFAFGAGLASTVGGDVDGLSFRR